MAASGGEGGVWVKGVGHYALYLIPNPIPIQETNVEHPGFDDLPHRVQLVLSVDNMNTSVSGRESLNGAAESGRDLLEIDVFDGTKSARAKNHCNASGLELKLASHTPVLVLCGLSRHP